MPEPTDPFTALRLPAVPLAPRPAFATDLRARLEAALVPQPDPTTPEVTPMSATDTTADATATSSPLVPYLAVHDAAAALDWYRDVLGAIETTRFVGDDGRIGHAEVVIGGARLMLADEFPELDVVGPRGRGGTTVTLHLEVVDVDHSHRLAVEAGAIDLRGPADQGHGSRTATITDPFGHRWMLSQPIAADRAARAEADRGAGGDGKDWTVTGRRPVEPGYLVLPTEDLGRARAFYGELFAWDIEDGNVPGGGHVGNTRFPLGFAPPSDDADRQGVGIYFRIDDIETYAARVVELGGQVLSRATYPSGGNAECVDDQGHRFDLFQPAPGY